MDDAYQMTAYYNSNFLWFTKLFYHLCLWQQTQVSLEDLLVETDKVFHRTWCLHYSLHVLLLELLNAFAFGFAVLLQGADLMHILIVEEL